MAQGTHYLKEVSRSGQVLWELVCCDACLAEHLKCFPEMAPGERRIFRPWSGRAAACGFCDETDEKNQIDPQRAGGPPMSAPETLIDLAFPEGKRKVKAVLLSPHVAIHKSQTVDATHYCVSDPVSGRRYPVVGFSTRTAAVRWAKSLISKFGDDPMQGGTVKDTSAPKPRWEKKPPNFEALKKFIHETNHGA